MTGYNFYIARLENWNASSVKVYDFIDLRIDSQAYNYLSMDYTTHSILRICVGHEQTHNSTLKEINTPSLINLKNT